MVSLTLAQVIGLLFSFTLSVNGAGLTPSSSQSTKRYTKAELIQRFDEILDEKLSGDNVYITLPAARQLEGLMRKGAAEIVNAKAFKRVPEAEDNIRTFADKLLERGTEPSGQIRISPVTINSTLHRVPNPHFPAFGGLCPLFPICR
jgi:hypothetical protein